MIDDIRASLRARRIALGISTRALAETLGVTYSVIPKWERALVEVPLYRLERWAEALGCRVDMRLVEADSTALAPPTAPPLSVAHVQLEQAFVEALPQMSEAEAATYCAVFRAVAARDTLLAAERQRALTPR